jgi:hypothetical protein
MITPWIGTKKILVIPTIVTGSNLYLPPPDNWVEQINRKIYYDPHPTTGLDRSLRGYLHTISYGKAQLVADISDPITVPAAADGSCRTGAAIQAHPHSHLYEFACVIFTDGPHSCGGMAAWGGLFQFSPARTGNILHGRTRVKFSESLGTWAMELLHITTGFGDLYFTNPNPGRFDEMACACGTHPSAYTKMNMGWISSSDIPFAANVQSKDYLLHAIGLLQPPPPNQVSAIRISAGSPGNYYIIECRLRVDQFETPTEGGSSGIPSEGIIIHEVNPSWPSALELRTPTALITGQEFILPNIGVTIKVREAINGGFKMNVQFPVNVVCDTMKNKINALEGMIASLQDRLGTASPNEKAGIIHMIRANQAEIKDLKTQMIELGCSTV